MFLLILKNWLGYDEFDYPQAAAASEAVNRCLALSRAMTLEDMLKAQHHNKFNTV